MAHLMAVFVVGAMAISGVLSEISLNKVKLTSSLATNVTTIQSNPMPAYLVASNFNEGNRSGKPLVTILASINYGGQYYPAGPICSEAMAIALEHISKQNDWLAGYNFAIELLDDECDDAVALSRYIAELEDKTKAPTRLPIFIASSCALIGQQVAIAISENHNLLTTSVLPALPEIYDDRKRYRNMLANGEPSHISYIALADFIIEMGWRKVAFLSTFYPYYDKMESHILKLLDERNITLLYMGKVLYQSEDFEEQSTMFSEMAARDPHVIIANTDTPVVLACFMQRFGMKGPHYKAFVTTWTIVDEQATIPTFIEKWCTRDMFKEGLKNIFFFGDSTVYEVFGNEARDSTGASYLQFVKEMNERVVEPEQDAAWQIWAPLCYDQGLVAGSAANQLESLLSKENQTLTDWTVGSPNFESNPLFMVGKTREALLTTAVKGLKGDYSIDRSTTINSGFVPMVFSQYQPGTDGKPSLVTVAYYKSNNKDAKLKIIKPILWYTTDGKPSKDAFKRVRLSEPLLPSTAYWFFVGFGIVLVFSSCILAAKLAQNRRNPKPDFGIKVSDPSISSEDVQIIMGALILLSHLFAIPYGVQNKVHINCSIEGMAIVAGFSFLITSQNVKLRRTAPSSLRVAHRYRNRNKRSLVPFIFATIQMALFAGYLATSNSVSTSTVEVSQVMDDYNGVIYEVFNYVCRFEIEKTTAALAIVVTMASLQALMLCHTGYYAFRAFTTREKDNSYHASNLKMTATCFYCEMLIVIAGVILGLLTSVSSANLQMTISATCMVVFGVIFSFIVVTKFTMHNLSSLISGNSLRATTYNDQARNYIP